MDTNSLAAMNLLSPDSESLPVTAAPTPVSSSPTPADSRSELQACNNNNNNNKPVKESFWSLILQVIITSPDTRADLIRENVEQCEECKLKAYAFSMEYR